MIVTVTCPACWEETAVEIAGHEGMVEQYEDCQVCCRPMRVRARFGGDDDDGGGEPWVEVEADG